MYDPAGAQGANDRLWGLIRSGLRDAGVAAPDALARGANDLWSQWTDPALVLSQTCGFPYRTRLHRQVALIGTPDYGVEGCQPGYYRSVLVVRADDPRERLADFHDSRFAYNDAMSQSGWAAPQNHMAALGLRLAPTAATGAHRLSALAVVENRADIAALDAVTWAMLTRWEPAVAGLRVLDQTEPTPGLPYIAAKGADVAVIFTAVAAAIAKLALEDRETLRLKGLVHIPPESYLSVPIPPAP